METPHARPEAEARRASKEPARPRGPTRQARTAEAAAGKAERRAGGRKQPSKTDPGLKALVEFLRTPAQHFPGLPE